MDRGPVHFEEIKKTNMKEDNEMYEINRSIKILVILVVVTAFGLFSNGLVQAGTLTDEDFVLLGRPVVVQGILSVDENDKWYLKADNEVYALHLGPQGYLVTRGFALKVGKKARAKGFLYENYLVVTELETDGKRAILRDETGCPFWMWTGCTSGCNATGLGSGRN